MGAQSEVLGPTRSAGCVRTKRRHTVSLPRVFRADSSRGGVVPASSAWGVSYCSEWILSGWMKMKSGVLVGAEALRVTVLRSFKKASLVDSGRRASNITSERIWLVPHFTTAAVEMSMFEEAEGGSESAIRYVFDNYVCAALVSNRGSVSETRKSKYFPSALAGKESHPPRLLINRAALTRAGPSKSTKRVREKKEKGEAKEEKRYLVLARVAKRRMPWCFREARECR